MNTARHQKPREVENLPLEEIAARYILRFGDRQADWAAFEDAKIEGYRRAQRRFIGGGGSGKHADPNAVPAGGFTLSVMFVPAGQGSLSHTHEVEEVFFVLQGSLRVFLEDDQGRRLSVVLGQWDCLACPAGVIHGYINDSEADVYFQVMLGKGRPETPAYASSLR